MSKEKPILFSTEMVQRILSGDKAQTRRAVKIPSWTWDKHDDLTLAENGALAANVKGEKGLCAINPPYAVGDVLWVRETWGIGIQMAGTVVYRTDYAEGRVSPLADGEVWKPSIHMPKDVARLYLEVVSVRAERLQDISETDALAEGSHKAVWPVNAQEGDKMQRPPTYKNGFSWIWDGLNAERGLGWEANPWVWVVEFAVKPVGGDADVVQR